MATQKRIEAAHAALVQLLRPHPEHARLPLLEAVAAVRPVFRLRVIYRLCYRSKLQIPRFDVEVHGSGGRFPGDDVVQTDALGIFACPSDWGFALRPPDAVSLSSLGLALPGGRVLAPEEVLAQPLVGSNGTPAPGAPEPAHPLLTLVRGAPFVTPISLEPRGGYTAGYRARSERDAALEEIGKHAVTTGLSEAAAAAHVAAHRAELGPIEHRVVLVRERAGRSDGSREAVYGNDLFHQDWRRRFEGNAFVIDDPPQPHWDALGIVELPVGFPEGTHSFPSAQQLADHSDIAGRYRWL